MKQIEREALAVLKNFTKMSEAEWKMVEIQVAQRGITNVKGVVLQELQYCAEKARGAVAKHPGHANQSAHGNGGSKGGATGAGASGAGGSASGGSGSIAEKDKGVKTPRASAEMTAKIQQGVGSERQVKSVVEVKVDGKLVGHVSREQHFSVSDGGVKSSAGHRYVPRDANGNGLGAFRSNYRDGGYVQERRTFSTANEAIMAVATGNTP